MIDQIMCIARECIRRIPRGKGKKGKNSQVARHNGFKLAEIASIEP